MINEQHESSTEDAWFPNVPREQLMSDLGIGNGQLSAILDKGLDLSRDADTGGLIEIWNIRTVDDEQDSE